MSKLLGSLCWGQDSNILQLSGKCMASQHALNNVGAIQAIHAVCSNDRGLVAEDGNLVSAVRSLEVALLLHGILQLVEE